MLTKLQRIGDDLALVIDPQFAEQLGFTEQTKVAITVRDGAIYVDPIDDKPEPSPDGRDG